MTPQKLRAFARRTISTHTLTWSVTLDLASENVFCYISTHTLTWSVTTGGLWVIPQYQNFNSHAHVERDEYGHAKKGGKGNFNSHAHVERDARAFINPMFNGISTHTLTWSVTRYRVGICKG